MGWTARKCYHAVMTEDLRVVTLRLPAEVHERLRRLAFERRNSINALVTGYVIAGLEAEEDGDRP